MSEEKQGEEPESGQGLAGKFLGAVGKAGGAVGNVAGLLLSTAGQAADSAGRRAALTFAATLRDQEIPPRSCAELAASLAAWLGDQALSVAPLAATQTRVVTVGEAGLLGKTYQVYICSELEPAALSLASAAPKRSVLVILQWPPEVLQVDPELAIFVWSEGVRLGPRRTAADYVSMWIRSELGFVFAARGLLEGRAEKPARGLFTGREEELARLARLLADGRAERRWIVALTAYSGTGKSYFVRRFEKLYGGRMLHALVDHNSVEVGGAAVTGLVSLLRQMASQFTRGGCPTPRFDKTLGQFSKVSTSSSEVAESRLSLYLKKSLQATSGLNPMLGLAQAGVKIYDTWSEEVKQEGESLASHTWVRLLTEALVEDLQPFVERQRNDFLLWRRPVLIFDTYEWLCVVVDTWLRTCLLANPSFQKLHPLILLAGRHELMRVDTRWSEYQEAICPLRLLPFARAEAFRYLKSLQVAEEKMDDYLELTGGLPLFLSLVANSQSVEAATRALTQRVLEEVEPSWRERFLEVSVLDGFNRDCLQALFAGEGEVGPIFERLSRATFVEAREGRWHYAQEIRKVLLRTLEMDSPERARQLQERARGLSVPLSDSDWAP